MKCHLIAAMVVSLLLAAPVRAQTPDDPSEGIRLEWDQTNANWHLKWWGRQGLTYFIQQSEDLKTWLYMPFIEQGSDSVLEWPFATTQEEFFLRLRHTDVVSADPEGDDFDGDSVSNLQEIMQGTDPLLNRDTDGDLLPDDWEIKYGLNPEADGDGPGNLDDDQFTNIEEFLAGLDPLDPLNGRPATGSNAPEAPHQPAVDQQAGATFATISWEDNSDNELLFHIERSENGGEWQKVGTVPANTTSFTDNTLIPDRVYFYRIVSRNNVPE